MEEANIGVRLSRVRPAQVGRLSEGAGCRAASPVGPSRWGWPARSGWPLTQPDILQPVRTAWVNGESVQRRLPSVDVRRVVERVRATLLLDPIADVGEVEPDVVPDLHNRDSSL